VYGSVHGGSRSYADSRRRTMEVNRFESDFSCQLLGWTSLIVRQYLRPSCPARPVYHLAARIGLAFLNSADVSKSKLPPLARIGHHYNVETAEILGCRVRDIAFWQPFQEI
jgi:hypothetical protein